MGFILTLLMLIEFLVICYKKSSEIDAFSGLFTIISIVTLIAISIYWNFYSTSPILIEQALTNENYSKNCANLYKFGKYPCLQNLSEYISHVFISTQILSVRYRPALID